MSKQDIAVIDFGSSKISVLVGQRGVNGSFSVKAFGDAEYSGFSDGEFFEQAKLKSVVASALNSAQKMYGQRISSVCVGVPGEFSTSVCKEASINFRSQRKITQLDVDALYEQADSFKNNEDYEVIGRSPIYYTLDDNGKVTRPFNFSVKKLGGFLCFVLAERSFINLITATLNSLGINDISFISSVLGEGLMLFNQGIRDRSVFLIDVGYITMNLAVIRGDGLLFMKTVPVGGGHISADLTEGLHISFADAEKLKNKIEFSIEVGENDFYDLETAGEIKQFPATLVHEIVAARIEEIAYFIDKCVKDSPYPVSDQIPTYLTGGGICYIRGAREYLSAVLDKKIDIVSPNFPQINKPHLSSVYGLLDLAIKEDEKTVKKSDGFVGFISRLFKRNDN